MKVIVFDASTLITLAMNGLLEELEKLKKSFKGKFVITGDVKKEIIDRPLTIRRFQFQAMEIKSMFDRGILETPDSLGILEKEIQSKTEEIMDKANSMFVENRGEIKIIHLGEASVLALGRILEEKKIDFLLAVDERTTRMLGEKPENLKKLLERKLHTKIRLQKKDFNFFKGFGFIRSSELMYIAYKKGLIRIKQGNVLEALLYALKFKGCSISDREILEIKRI
jgi:hypothetical protein